MIRENYTFTLSKRLDRLAAVSTDEIVRAIQICDARAKLHRTRDVVRVIANTGIMMREFQALKASDVDQRTNRLHIGEKRSSIHGDRFIPIGPATMRSLLWLRQRHAESQFILGDHPRVPIDRAVIQLNSLCPRLARGRNVLQAVRANYRFRLLSSGIPLGIVNYCCGRTPLSSFARQLTISQEQRLEIVRRNLSSFLPEL